MSSIDVSEILNDPDFVQELTLIRRSSCVDGYGQNRIAETPICTIGCVQPISGRTLQRLPDAMRNANVQSFWIKQKLVNDSRSAYPDVIVKQGKRFIVQVVFDWSDWGEGYTEGTCVAQGTNQ